MAHELLAYKGVGDQFEGTYYVEQAYVKKTVQGKDYTDMLLRDKSGARNVKHWGKVKGLVAGTWVFVACNVDEYQGNPSIIAKNIEMVDEPKDLSDYIPKYDGSEELATEFDALRAELAGLEKQTGDNTCGKLIDEVYRSGAFFEKFLKCPGNDGPSYGKQGGLLACVVRLGRHALDASKFYNATDSEKSVVLTAARLCRLGAAEAYDFENCMPKMTKAGILFGLPNLTFTRVTSALRRVHAAAAKENAEVNKEMVDRILHAVVAANDTCGVLPMMKEAMVLSGVVKMDAELVDAMDFIANDLNPAEEFTAYDPRLKRRYYRGQGDGDKRS